MNGLFGKINRVPLSIDKDSGSEYLSGMKKNLIKVNSVYDKRQIKLAAMELLSEAAEIYDNIGDSERASEITDVIGILSEGDSFEDE